MDPLVEHPIVAAVGAVRTTLEGVGDANPTFMTTDDKAHALTELVRAEGQLAELRLRILADAGDLAQAAATKDAAGWPAGQEPAAGSGCGRSGRAVTGT